MRAIWFSLVFIAASWAVTRPFMPIERPPGVLVAAEPYQGELLEDAPVFRTGDWVLKPLATYEIQARVLGISRYRFDSVADIAPYDLLLGWGPMSDSAVVDDMAFDQRGRFGYWSFPHGASLDEREINRHVANTHPIPANERVRDRIASLKVGSVVRLRGHLVEAIHPAGGEPWRSSLTRTDRGAGACEIIYVESISAR